MKNESNIPVRRILMIYQLFKQYKKLTSSEIFDYISDEFQVDLRTIQRDLALLADEEIIYKVDGGRYTKWELTNNWNQRVSKPKLTDSEFLSFHILKAYLRSFEGTNIQNDLNHISEILEQLAPGFETAEDEFFGDQSFGHYDYTDKKETLRQIIRHINEKNWIHIKYSRNLDDTVHEYNLFPYYLYTYYGTIYLIAYHPKIKEPANFVIQNIINIDKIEVDVHIKPPEFDYKKFKEKRFAVFGGEVEDVKLLIKKEYLKYFENRKWHPSQKFRKANNEGDYYLSMSVPISFEFVSWICWWGDAIKVISPKTLIEKVKNHLENSLKMYQ